MNTETQSILAAVDRNGEEARRVAVKAMTLANLTGAHLELFLCDAEAAFNRQHQYEPNAAARARDSCLVESRRFLETLRRALAVRGVEVSLRVACESPLYGSIVHAVECDRSDLVVRGAAAGAPLDPNDWELARACPVPLFLTRGKPWKPQPIVAAAVDISPGESSELTDSILRMAARFAKVAQGTVEIMHAGPFDSMPPLAVDASRAALEVLARRAELEGAAIHLVTGEPAAALRELSLRRGFDLIVLGALTHRKALTALVGTLTGRLIESLDCDFLLVKPAPEAAAA